MQYGNEWLIHKFNITKPYFEKIVKKIVLKFFKNLSLMKYYTMIKINIYPRFFIIEQAFGQISRQFQILLNFTSMTILPRCLVH